MNVSMQSKYQRCRANVVVKKLPQDVTSAHTNFVILNHMNAAPLKVNQQNKNWKFPKRINILPIINIRLEKHPKIVKHFCAVNGTKFQK